MHTIDHSGLNPLSLACSLGHEEIVNLFLMNLVIVKEEEK